MSSRAWGIGALSIALGMSFAGCSSDESDGGDEGGEAGVANSGGQGGSAGKGGSSGKGGASAGRGGSGGQGGTAGSAGEGGAAAGQAGTPATNEGGNAGEPDPSDAGQSGASQGGTASGGETSAGGAGAGEGGASPGGEGGALTGGEAGNAGVAASSGGEAGGPPALGVITVFDGGTRNTGATWEGRAGLDAVCLTAQAALEIEGGTPRALISVSAADDIADFPALYGLPTDLAFASRGGEVIADDFADLLDGSIDLSIEEAGILEGEPDFWFTGSNADGTASANTCEGWTFEDLDNSIRANYGHTGSTDSEWLAVNFTATCGAGQYHVLCVSW